jgi:hypothetical protein
VIDMSWWRRRARRYDAPDKGRLYASDDELLAQRLRELRLPDPPPGLRERGRQTYGEWLQGRGSRNPWRDR